MNGFVYLKFFYLWNSDSGSLENWVVLHPLRSKRSPKNRIAEIPLFASLRSSCSYRQKRFLSRQSIVEFICKIHN